MRMWGYVPTRTRSSKLGAGHHSARSLQAGAGIVWVAHPTLHSLYGLEVFCPSPLTSHPSPLTVTSLWSPRFAS